MSGEDATPFVILDEQTRLLVENLGHSTIVARSTDNTVANVDAARDGAEPIAARDAISSPPRSAGGDGGRATASIEAGDEGTVEVAKGATAAQSGSLQIRPSAAAGTRPTMAPRQAALRDPRAL
jgi:hypothetical protein